MDDDNDLDLLGVASLIDECQMSESPSPPVKKGSGRQTRSKAKVTVSVEPGREEGQGLPSASVPGLSAESSSSTAEPAEGMSFAELLKKKIEARLQEETTEKAKSDESVRQALTDQDAAKNAIPLTLALIDYLGDLEQNLKNHPEEYHCSLNLPDHS